MSNSSITTQRWWWQRWQDVAISYIRECASRRRRHHMPSQLKRSSFPNIIVTKEACRYSAGPIALLLHEDDESTPPPSPLPLLVVFIHGLKSSPLSWTRYIRELLRQGQGQGQGSSQITHYFAPNVKHRGMCPVHDAAQPIFAELLAFRRLHPSARIVLVGHSLGARIAAYLECLMTSAYFPDVALVSISGPYLGTRIPATLLRWCFGFSSELAEEFSYGTAESRKFLERWQRTASSSSTSLRRRRLFAATADDLRIFPVIETSFPSFPNSEYMLVSRESHVTVIDADPVFRKVMHFIDR